MYQPLFLKYRPQTFSQLVGQGPIVTTLGNALKTNRLAHAYLFTGSRGTGKTSTARILAKAVNCELGISPEPCGKCGLCKAITQGNALDIIEIDAASNTGVDNIREIIERAQLSPAQARYKVYVIDECHMLSSAAFNALLKTLEEPPDRVIFILATTDPQRVLPTIISRCQRFDFKRIALADMTAHLAKIAGLENISITPAALELVAQIAQGGLRDAESLLDQLGLLEGAIEVDHVWNLVGAVPERDLLALLLALHQRTGTEVIGLVRKLMDHGREPLQVLQDFVGFLRDTFLAKVAPSQQDWVALTKPTWDQLVQLGPQLDAAWITRLQTTLREAEPLIKHSTQPRMWLEVTLLELTQVHAPVVVVPRQEIPRSPEFSKPVESPRTPELSQPAEIPRTPEIPRIVEIPKAPIPVQVSGTLSTHWVDFTALLRPHAKAIIAQAFVAREDDQTVVIAFKDKFFINMLRDPRQGGKKREEIIQAIERFLGKRITVHFELVSTAESAPVPVAHAVPTSSYLPPPAQLPAPLPTPTVQFPVAQPVATHPAPKPLEVQALDRAALEFANFFNGTVVKEDLTATVVETSEDEDDF